MQCRSLGGGCQGASLGLVSANNCFPYTIWSGTSLGSERYIGISNNGLFLARVGYEERPITIAHGVRCVLDLTYAF